LSRNSSRILFTGSNDSLELARYDGRLNRFVPYLSGLSVRHASFSKDGEWVAYVTVPGYLLWRSRVDGRDRVQLTFPPMAVADPQWSPDGRQIAFSASSSGKPPSIFLVSADGGTPQPGVPEDSDHLVRPDWSLLGNALLFTRVTPERNGQGEKSSIYHVDLKTGRQSLFSGSESKRDPARSPDGRFVAALADNFKRLMLFNSQSQQWTELASGGHLFGLAWSRDSKYVYSQDLSGDSGQPIFRVRVSDRKMDGIATSKEILRSDVTTCRFLGLGPDGSPLVTLVHNNTDIYKPAGESLAQLPHF
jgi:Tol biopolymer transport system component